MIKQYKENILSYYKSIEKPYPIHWSLWYLNTHVWLHELSDKYCKSIEFLAAACSIMSINKKWKENRKMLITYLETGNIAGLPIVKTKIEKLEDCDLSHDCIMSILNGPKLQNFYGNLIRPYALNFICVDRHMARIAGEDRRPEDKKYRELGQAYKEVAFTLNMIPNRLQSLLWCHYVNNK